MASRSAKCWWPCRTIPPPRTSLAGCVGCMSTSSTTAGPRPTSAASGSSTSPTVPAQHRVRHDAAHPLGGLPVGGPARADRRRGRRRTGPTREHTGMGRRRRPARSSSRSTQASRSGPASRPPRRSPARRPAPRMPSPSTAPTPEPSATPTCSVVRLSSRHVSPGPPADPGERPSPSPAGGPPTGSPPCSERGTPAAHTSRSTPPTRLPGCATSSKTAARWRSSPMTAAPTTSPPCLQVARRRQLGGRSGRDIARPGPRSSRVLHLHVGIDRPPEGRPYLARRAGGVPLSMDEVVPLAGTDTVPAVTTPIVRHRRTRDVAAPAARCPHRCGHRGHAPATASLSPAASPSSAPPSCSSRRRDGTSSSTPDGRRCPGSEPWPVPNPCHRRWLLSCSGAAPRCGTSTAPPRPRSGPACTASARRTPAVRRCRSGRPLANTHVYVLDHAGQLAPVGTTGLIHLAGTSLADGYHRRDESTRARVHARPRTVQGRPASTAPVTAACSRGRAAGVPGPRRQPGQGPRGAHRAGGGRCSPPGGAGRCQGDVSRAARRAGRRPARRLHRPWRRCAGGRPAQGGRRHGAPRRHGSHALGVPRASFR